MRKKYSFLLIVLLVTLTNAQTAGEEELMVYRSPSVKFHDITIQKHQGLPRFGVFDNYLPAGQKPTRSVFTPEIRKKQALTQKGLKNYSLMVSLKYVKPLMKDLDKDRLTMPSGNTDDTRRNSIFLQNFLLRQVAPSICVTDDCQNAGQGSNEFERLRNYKAFVDNCLGPLQKWSTSFMENDELTAYHVSQLAIGNSYDFDRKGYWTYHYFSLNDIFPHKMAGGFKKISFEPVATYENNLKNKLDRRAGLQFLLQLDEKAAERFQVNRVYSLYLVKKIRLKHLDKELINASQPLEFIYSHESPKVMVYEDAGLTKLVTELSLENLIFKTN
ncbi:hypothetical protein [Flagellimonas flava]|uniref:hypothetical protein n=1 Tax=Flagellimonas flava TaxID=570519 RepID=UPI003D6609EA